MSNNLILLLIFLPIIAGTAIMFLKKKAWGVAAAVSAFSLILSVLIFLNGKMSVSYLLHDIGVSLSFFTNELNSLVIVLVRYFARQ